MVWRRNLCLGLAISIVMLTIVLTGYGQVSTGSITGRASDASGA